MALNPRVQGVVEQPRRVGRVGNLVQQHRAEGSGLT
jgi:hypothetical protein